MWGKSSDAPNLPEPGRTCVLWERMKQEAPFFEGKEAVLIYIAKKLKDALRLEETLTAAGIDYGVEADEYRGGVIFRSTRVGAFFYVVKDGVDTAHAVMRNYGFSPVVENGE
jgi:hypothetical protein